MNSNTNEAKVYIGYANAGEVDQNTAALVAAQNATTYAILALVDELREQSQPATYVMNAETCEECSGRTVAEMLDRNRIAYREHTGMAYLDGGRLEGNET